MITIINYGLGNLASVANALKKLEIPFEISSNNNAIKNAKALILPGVGAAGQGMENLIKSGINNVLYEQAQKGTPILGICLGMQLLLSSSEEGNVACLGLVEGKVKKINTYEKVPQIGWNQVHLVNNKSKLAKSILDNQYVYFVNSYICVPEDTSIITGVTSYGGTFCSIFERKRIFGVQFHPEKSGETGLQILKNFWEEVC